MSTYASILTRSSQDVIFRCYLQHLLSPHPTTERITNNTQNNQKIELYGSLTTKDLKKPHSSRQAGGARDRQEARRRSVVQRWQQGQKGQSNIYVWWVKIGKDTLGDSNPSPSPDCTAQGSSTRKINPHKFWL